MKHILEGGTDAGSMLLFDPAALPDGYDESARTDPTSILDEATLNGDANWISTNGDGAYLLHLFVDEPVTPELTKFLQDEESVPHFKIPSGRLYFTGVEYGFRHDDSFLRKHLHMGSMINIEPGSYSLTLYRTEYPEDLMDDQLRSRVSQFSFHLHQSMGWFIMLALAGAACVILPFFKFGLPLLLVPLGLALIASPFALARLPIYRDTEKIWTEIQHNYPSIVATLTHL